MRTDAVFFGAHPDDIELTCGGLAAQLAAHGHRVVLVDLTRGEAGSRGTPEIRAAEAQAAAQALGVAAREPLGLPDLGLDRSDRVQLSVVVACLRRLRPALVVAPHHRDLHPDHVEAAHLVTRACHHAGVLKFEAPGERHRPDLLLYALYRGFERPHLVVDVTETWERRATALRAHRSQLEGDGPVTYLTHPDFLSEVEARARVFGAAIGARYGEGYRLSRPLRVADARMLLSSARSEVRP